MDPITIAVAGLVIAGAGLGVSLGNPTIKAWLKRSRKRKGLYKTVLKKSTDLQPEEVMGELRGSHKGGFRDYCLPRDEINQIRKRIDAGNHVLVVGDPLAGKSRAVYEALKHTKNPSNVTIPRIVDVDTNEFKLIQYISGTRKGVLLVDDINKYVVKQHFEFLLEQYIDKGYLIVATCRNGPELARAKSKLEQIFASLFNDPVELGKVERGEAEVVAKATGITMPVDYDSNIGSIFVPIEAMRLRYANECDDKGRAVLRSIKRLFMAGVYKEGGIFSETHVKEVCGKTEGLKLEEYKWKPVFESLTELAFLSPGKDGIAVEETYIEQIFTFDSSLLDNFRELAELFSDDPDALYKVGYRANDTDYSEDLGDDFVNVKRLAVDVLQSVLSHRPLKTHPEQHAMTQNNLGIANAKLGDIEDKAVNCKKAIDAYQEALKVYTLDRIPMDYAMTQANLGVAYSGLSEVEDTSASCQNANAAYYEALKVHTLERYPIQFANTQNNLGNSYDTLAQVQDKAVNGKKAVAAFQEALKVRTLANFPVDYAMTQNNLGTAYGCLGDIADKAANCKRAIVAYQEALKVYTRELFPTEHAITMNNLGNANQRLGDVEEKAANCRKAIAAYQDALKVMTLERFPMDYAMTQSNLGVAYRKLGDIESNAADLKNAIAAYEEALKVRTLERLPIQFANTQNNLGVAFKCLGAIEVKSANCKGAREAHEAALSVYRKLEMPLQVQMVERNIARLDAFEAEE